MLPHYKFKAVTIMRIKRLTMAVAVLATAATLKHKPTMIRCVLTLGRFTSRRRNSVSWHEGYGRYS